MKRRTTVALAIATAVALTGVAFVSTSALSSEPRGDDTDPSLSHSSEEEKAADEAFLADEARRIEIGKLADPSISPGVGIAEGGNGYIIRVFAGADGTALEETVKSEFPEVEVLPSHFTSETFHELEAAIGSVAIEDGQGIGFDFDAVSDSFRVSGSVPAETMSKHLASFEGEYYYEFTEEGQTGRLSRISDPAPHKGGAQIVSSSGVVCSSGITVKVGGVNRMLTAGHCGVLNSYWSSTGGQYFGTMTGRAPFPAFDLAFVSGSSYHPWAYIGGTNSSMIRAVSTSIGNPGLGGQYCSGGATTGEHCSHAVQSLSSNFCDSSGCTYKLMRINGGALIDGGDSGGPFYGTPNTNIKFRGILVAKDYNDAFIEPWARIVQQFGATIVPYSG